METTTYKLKDVLKIGNGKDHSSLPDGEYPVLGSGGIMRYANRYLYDGESVLLPRKGTLNNIQYIKGKFWTVDTCYYTIINQDITHPYYLYRLLRTFDLSGLDSGASIPSMTSKTYYGIKVQLPPLPTQQKIASILSAYDNLIQNYKKQIEALQTAASELYKEWFVRFRFPGWQNAKFENGIPEGWKIVRVGDYVKIKSGFAFKSEWWQDEGCPVVKIKDIDNGEIVITDLDFVSEEHTKKAKSFLLNEGDLVIAMTGATIGKIGLAPKIKNLYTNQRVGKFFLPENPFETMPFLYCLFSQNSTVETILCLSGASSAQPNISPDQLESIKFFFNEDIVFQFNKKSAPFFRKILKLREQITNLTQQRDLLLPRFMSGKLEV